MKRILKILHQGRWKAYIVVGMELHLFPFSNALQFGWLIAKSYFRGMGGITCMGASLWNKTFESAKPHFTFIGYYVPQSKGLCGSTVAIVIRWKWLTGVKSNIVDIVITAERTCIKLLQHWTVILLSHTNTAWHEKNATSNKLQYILTIFELWIE